MHLPLHSRLRSTVGARPAPRVAGPSLRRCLRLRQADVRAPAAEGGGATRLHGCVVLGAVWRSKEDADVVKLKVAMPTLGKEHVKVWTDQDELAIEGETEKDPEFDEDEEPTAWHSHCIEFLMDAYKMDQIEAAIKNGVLMVNVPKIKLEDRKDVFQV